MSSPSVFVGYADFMGGNDVGWVERRILRRSPVVEIVSYFKEFMKRERFLRRSDFLIHKGSSTAE